MQLISQQDEDPHIDEDNPHTRVTANHKERNRKKKSGADVGKKLRRGRRGKKTRTRHKCSK
jgi:hypothetical protein